MRQHQGGAVRGFQHLRHREGLARPGYTQQHLVFFAGFDTTNELLNRRGLVAARLVLADEFKVHRALSVVRAEK